MLRLEDFRDWFAARGLVLYAVTPIPRNAELGTDFEAYDRALAEGYHAGMRFLADRRNERRDPETLLPQARSSIVVAFPYGAVGSCEDPIAEAATPAPGCRVASLVAGFSQVKNYHPAIRKALDALGNEIARTAGPEFRWRAIADSAPFLEKAYARLAGMGSQGKNTLLLTAAHGSAFALGELITNAEFEPFCSRDANEPLPDCGSCRRCIDVCPTGALVAPRVLDARRCRAYLTVEHRGPVADGFVNLFSTTVFGCDACQTVCPYTRKFMKSLPSPSSVFERVDWQDLDVFDLATMSRRDFDRRFGDTSLSRARHDGMVRNALYHLFATKNPRLKTALAHWEGTESKNIRAVVEQIRSLAASRTSAQASHSPG